MRKTLISIATGALLFTAAGTGSATAAVTIGTTTTPTVTCGGPLGGSTWTQRQPPTGPAVSYVAPTDGVITSWSFPGGAEVPRGVRLKMLRVTTAPQYRTVGQSRLENPNVDMVNVYKTRVPAKAGDQIAVYHTGTSFICAFIPASGSLGGIGGDPALDSLFNLSPAGGIVALSLAAQLELDADNDGFGDETQDLCPTNASTQGACPTAGPAADKTPPETTITKAPPAKTAKKKTTVEFSSNEAGATFECSLDGAAFEACTSPKALTVKPGKHKVAVRAKDAAGNVDATPATASWKVKKKRK